MPGSTPMPTISGHQRLIVTLACSAMMALAAAFTAVVVSKYVFAFLGSSAVNWPLIYRYVLTGLICELPLWFVGAGYLLSRKLAVRLLFGALLGLINALLSQGFLLFSADMLHWAGQGFTGGSLTWILHSLGGSLLFGLTWLSLVGKFTLPLGALFGALTSLLMPLILNQRQS